MVSTGADPLPISRRADDRGMEALAYDAEADEKSWQAMLDLFAEVFPRDTPDEEAPASDTEDSTR